MPKLAQQSTTDRGTAVVGHQQFNAYLSIAICCFTSCEKNDYIIYCRSPFQIVLYSTDNCRDNLASYTHEQCWLIKCSSYITIVHTYSICMCKLALKGMPRQSLSSKYVRITQNCIHTTSVVCSTIPASTSVDVYIRTYDPPTHPPSTPLCTIH